MAPSETAMLVAEFLQEEVGQVWYPGLTSHDRHETAKRQMTAFGGMLAFEVAGATAAEAVVEGLRVFKNATSLGGVESLAEHRLRSDPTAPPGLIRLSIGLENPDALIADLAAALAAA